MTMLRTASRLEGLAKGRISGVQVLAQSVSAVAPSAVMVTLPVVLLPAVGRAAPVVFGLVALLVVGVALCINQFARRMVAVSGAYSFVVQGLGPRWGYATGVSAAVGYGGAAMASVLGAGSYVRAVVVDLGGPGSAAVTTAGCLLVGTLAVLLMVRGVRLSAIAMLVVEAVAIVLVVVVLLVVAVGDVRVLVDADTVAAGSWGLVLLIALTSYVGFESATTVAREARSPFRVVPRAVVWTPVVTGTLFVFAAFVLSRPGVAQVGSSGDVGLRLAPGGLGLAALEVAMHLGVLASWCACVIGSTTALSRTVFALAREGVLPGALGATHPRHGTPHRALLVLGTVLTFVPVAALLAGRPGMELLVDLLALSAHGYVVAYLVVVVATPVFLHRIGELTAPPLLVSAVVGSALAVVVGWGVVEGGDRYLWPTLTWAVTVVAGFGLVAVRRRRHPDLVARLGVYDEPTVDDVLETRPRS